MNRRTLYIALALLILLVLSQSGVTEPASAQSGGGYDLTWNTIDDGGGTSAGGAYSLSGTIGQPDAGTMSGGSYTLNGGFWVGFANQSLYLPLILK